MRKYLYSAFSPSGNYTLFLHGKGGDSLERARLCEIAMKHILAEQAGFVDIGAHELMMAGGEFCVNASRAFGALLRMEGKGEGGLRRFRATVSGIPVDLYVEGDSPSWRVRVEFAADGLEARALGNGMVLVEMPGISHLLVHSGIFPKKDELALEAQRLTEKAGIASARAWGVSWWRPKGRAIEIWPFVGVPGAGSAMLENSCGSASLALAFANHSASVVSIMQPSGQSLEVSVHSGVAAVAGGVDLVSVGKVWL